MTPNRLITLAIHTYEKALPIKNLLEREGLHVELNNVNLASPVVSAGVRIRVLEADLPLALRIVENFEIFAVPDTDVISEKRKILVPTDFSECSFNAAMPAIRIAARLKCEIDFIYSYITPVGREDVQLSDVYDYEMADVEASHMLQTEAESLMSRFAERIREVMKEGRIPVVKFGTVVTEGLPEEVILEYTRENKPVMVVMGTRAAQKKESELIGSVTAEVLDGCRVPAFTVPETVDSFGLGNMKKVAFFCNLDQEDMLALDALYRFFPDMHLDVTLFNVPRRSLRKSIVPARQTADNLLKYCREHFANYSFTLGSVELPISEEQFRAPDGKMDYDLLCMPNKRKSVFLRVFNPSLAHRVLFRADIPMIVIPV